MTLKEQFENAPKVYNQNLESFIDYTSIADEFAIGFAEWFTNEQSPYSIIHGNQEVRFSDFRKDYTIKELLKMYKIQKGL
jgi:hypothetical protein